MNKYDELTCDNCGNEYQEHFMFRLNTGRRTQFLCPKCYSKGMLDAGLILGERRAVSVKIRKYKK